MIQQRSMIKAVTLASELNLFASGNNKDSMFYKSDYSNQPKWRNHWISLVCQEVCAKTSSKTGTNQIKYT